MEIFQSAERNFDWIVDYLMNASAGGVRDEANLSKVRVAESSAEVVQEGMKHLKKILMELEHLGEFE